MALTSWDIVGVVCVLGFASALAGKIAPDLDTPPPAVAEQVEATTGLRLGDEWLGLTFRGERVGYIHVAKSAREGGGIRYAVDTRFRLMAQASMHLVIGADLDPQLALERFDFRVDAGLAIFEGDAEVEADAIDLRYETGGTAHQRRIPLNGKPVLKDTIGPALSRIDLTPGARHTLSAFDPLSQANQPVEIEVVGPDEVIVMGEVQACTHLRQTIRGVTLDAWMNERGEMLRQELGLGLIAVRESEEEARWGYVQAKAGRSSADLRAATSIAVPGLGDLGRRDLLKLRIAGLPKGESIDDRRQTVRDGVLSIRREAVGDGVVIPVRQGEALEAEPLIQVNDPAIQAAAKRAIAGAGDSVTAARRLMRFVNAHVDEQVVVGVPSAAEVLANARGDCNEHAILFAALGRAVGLPTRIVSGLVYQDDRFAWHAWNEVRTAAGWLSVDPTWGQMPVDVGHLRLVSGGAGAQLDLLKFMGRLRLRRLER